MSLKCVQIFLVVLGVVDMCQLLFNGNPFKCSLSFFFFFLFWFLQVSDQNFVRKAVGNRIFQEFRVDFFSDGMVASLETLSLIVEGNDTTAFMEDPILKEMKPYLMKLNHALGLVHGKGQLI